MRKAHGPARSRAERPVRERPVPARRRAGRPSLVMIVVTAVLFAWATGMSWMAFEGRRTIAQMAEQQAELQQAADAKVKALTRRLVGVASHQVLERDGLEGRMADLITRQVELENRQALLTSLTEQAGLSPVLALGAAGAPGLPSAPGKGLAEPAAAITGGKARGSDPAGPMRGAPDAAPILRLGQQPAGPARAPLGPLPPAAAGPEPGADFMRIKPEDLMSPSGGDKSGKPLSQLSLRDQFARLETSMDKVGRDQVRSLAGMVRGTQAQAALVRTALSEAGLDPDRLQPQPGKTGRTGIGGPLIPLLRPKRELDPFEAGVQEVNRAMAQLAAWKPVTEAVPFRRPVEGENNLTSNFGPRSDPFTGATAMHAGMDFRSPIGTPVRAAAAGRVVTAEVSGGYGNLVELDHGRGLATRYGHLSEILVKHGDMVAPGAVIGLIGSTGRSTGPHLHYETRVTGAAVDPIRFLQAGMRLSAKPTTTAPTLDAASASDPADD
jgi:murein DD-endopeptidase MepM/ murein hydrolase activator NlpD